MKYFYLYFIFGLFICLYGENIKQLEKNFLLLDQDISHRKLIIDSLTKELDHQVVYIEQQKQKGKNVSDLMARALLVSQEIKREQVRLKKLDKALEIHIGNLDSVYTLMIDSLKRKESLFVQGSEKGHIQKEIYLLTGKRFLLTPVFYALSFKPEKIQDINLRKVRDEFEIEIFREYLQNADFQLENYLTEIQKTRKDVQQLSRLQKRTHEFLEDIQDDGSWAVLDNQNTSNEIYGGTDLPVETDRTSKQFSVSSQFLHNYSNYQNLWMQLNNVSDKDITLSRQIKKDSIPENLSLEDYDDLLEKLETKLKSCLKEIRQKMDTN